MNIIRVLLFCAILGSFINLSSENERHDRIRRADPSQEDIGEVETIIDRIEEAENARPLYEVLDKNDANKKKKGASPSTTSARSNVNADYGTKGGRKSGQESRFKSPTFRARAKSQVQRSTEQQTNNIEEASLQ